MNGYKLKKLYIENFKLITQREIDFNSLDLMILNGPNGYGKTTIYDSLELLFSKKISRIDDSKVDDDRNGHEDSLFAKDKTKPIIIKAELEKENLDSLYLGIYLPESENSKKWENYQQYELGSYGENILDGVKVDNFDELLGLNIDKVILSDDFKNFYYIQQENNTQFFKKSEKERIKLLSKFFGTEDAEELKDDLLKKLKKIKDLKKIITESLKTKKEDYKKLEEQSVSAVNKDAKYISLSTEKLWDKEEFTPTNNEKLKEIIEEVLDIKNLINYFSTFEMHTKNEKLSEIKSSEIDLKRFMVLANFKNKYTDIKKLYEKEEKYRSIKKIIEEQDYENLKKQKLKELFESFTIDEYEKKIDSIDNITETIDKYIKESGEMSDISRLINDARDSLFKEYKKFDDTTKNKGECPLCGYDKWASFEKFEEEFKKKKVFFEEFQDEKTKLAKDLKEDLFKAKLKEILEKINQYLEVEEHLVNKKFYLQLSEYYDETKYELFLNNIMKLEIYEELLKFANSDQKEVEDFESILQKIFEVIDSKIIMITEEEFNEKKESIIRGFKTYNISLEKIKELNLTGEKVKQKKEWLEFKYYSNEEKKKNSIKNEIDKLDEKKELLNKLMTSSTKGITKELHDKLDKNIKNQWKDVIKQIEIPLYIYSGKILQDTQRGNGIFIDFDINKKDSPLKFLSTLDSDYDATYSMSTGQLSALVVSLTLALNKVYGKSDNGGLLLIDDPMQSMDEMNITSFIELIRNDFENTQFILSTHESKISRLLHYKYLKYNKQVKPYSVKDEFFNEVTE
ncbi:MAG: AAA family ATPase [Sulfurimonas sp.]|jgi:exonuclease SbcC|nr:AAA family ATPase [Sulfurimonas sp.]